MAESPVSTNDGPPSKPKSQMREFLESGQDWKWPSHLGQCSGRHCELKSNQQLPFIWNKKIYHGKATIDKSETDPKSGIDFQGFFVVKTPRESGSKKARQVTANEVNTMKDLRYPHITALLGSCEFQGTQSILIFPAARCDLRHFMKHLSVDTLHLREHPAVSHVRRISEDTITSDDTPRPISSLSPPKMNASQGSESDGYDTALGLSCGQRFRILRRFPVCLSQALSYLHENDVRHKDIKPENILIDESYNVLLTDFGISRKFEKDAPHTTNNEWNFTRKYASPEMMAGKQSARGDPSDVFSLGCVFLEMATLLLGKSLRDLTDHYTTQSNASPQNGDAYFDNLDSVYKWIQLLQKSATAPGKIVSEIEEQIYEENDIQESRARFSQPLLGIRDMLDHEPKKRPRSKELWKIFKDVSPEWCEDCDPRQEDKIWKPSDQQIEDSQRGRDKRRSIREEEISDGFQQGAADPQYLSVNQAQGSRSPRAQRPESLIPRFNPRTSGVTELIEPQAVQAFPPQERRSLLARLWSRKRSRGPSVLIYDLRKKTPYIAPSITLSDREVLEYDIARSKKHVNIGDQARLTAKVDLGSLSFYTKVGRFFGRYSKLHVVNYDKASYETP